VTALAFSLGGLLRVGLGVLLFLFVLLIGWFHIEIIISKGSSDVRLEASNDDWVVYLLCNIVLKLGKHGILILLFIIILLFELLHVDCFEEVEEGLLLNLLYTDFLLASFLVLLFLLHALHSHVLSLLPVYSIAVRLLRRPILIQQKLLYQTVVAEPFVIREVELYREDSRVVGL
jgi:hypothetical protein